MSDQARAAYDRSDALYRDTVLVAFREVEDNLAALRILEAEATMQAAAGTCVTPVAAVEVHGRST